MLKDRDRALRLEWLDICNVLFPSCKVTESQIVRDFTEVYGCYIKYASPLSMEVTRCSPQTLLDACLGDRSFSSPNEKMGRNALQKYPLPTEK